MATKRIVISTTQPRTRARSRSKRSTGSVVARWAGRKTWAATKWTARKTGTYTARVTVRAAKAAAEPVRDYTEFGVPGHVDCACGWRGPSHQLAAHLGEHDGEQAPAERKTRPSSLAAREREVEQRGRRIKVKAERVDVQRDAGRTYRSWRLPWQPAEEIECPNCGDKQRGARAMARHAKQCWQQVIDHAVARRDTRVEQPPDIDEDEDRPQPATVAAVEPAEKETAVSEIGQGIEGLTEYELDSPHDLPALYTSAASFFGEVAERLEAMIADNQAHRVPPGVIQHLTNAMEGVTSAQASCTAASQQMTEHLEYVPTYGNSGSAAA